MADYTIPDKKAVEKTVKSIFRLLFPNTNSYSDTESENSVNYSKNLLAWIAYWFNK